MRESINQKLVYHLELSWNQWTKNFKNLLGNESGGRMTIIFLIITILYYINYILLSLLFLYAYLTYMPSTS